MFLTALKAVKRAFDWRVVLGQQRRQVRVHTVEQQTSDTMGEPFEERVVIHGRAMHRVRIRVQITV